MGFGYRTRNILNDVQKKSVVVGRDLGWDEIAIYAVLAVAAAYFAFVANVALPWRAFGVWACFTSALAYTGKRNGRVLWQWFRIFLRKKTR